MELLVHLRNSLTEHTAIGRALSILEKDHEIKFNSDIIIKAYAMFDALSNTSHSFSCFQCGNHPVVLNFDVSRKACFKLPKISVDPNKQQCKTVNMHDFWNNVFLSAIGDGVFYGKENPFKVDPSFDFWAPWINPETLIGSDVFNTEYEKVNDSVANNISESVLHNLTEDRLEELLLKGTVSELKELCEACNITHKCGTKLDMVVALKSAG